MPDDLRPLRTGYSPPEADRIRDLGARVSVYYGKILIYPIFYLLMRDYKRLGFWGLGLWDQRIFRV